ncbi:unnamed protein product [Effrenium voratum]|nr:unnamed protein product [Effrenium voratum]
MERRIDMFDYEHLDMAEEEPAPKAPSLPEEEPAPKAPSLPEEESAPKAPSLPEEEPAPKAPSLPEEEPAPTAPSLPEERKPKRNPGSAARGTSGLCRARLGSACTAASRHHRRLTSRRAASRPRS